MPPEERLRRAEGLRQLGAVFLAATSPENAQDGPKKTFRQQLEGFVQTMMPTASGDAEAEAAAAEAAAEKGGLLGRRVLIHGLQAKPELNGRAGVAVQFDGEKRCVACNREAPFLSSTVCTHFNRSRLLFPIVGGRATRRQRNDSHEPILPPSPRTPSPSQSVLCDVA